MPSDMTRRVFLQASAALIVYAAVREPVFAQTGAGLPGSLRRNPELDSWLRINADGSLSVFSGKVELGQGILTALAQIAADELDVALARVHMEPVDTAHSPNEGRTVGSNSIPVGGAALRVAAADARAVLLGNAAQRLGVAPARLAVDDGRILLDGRLQSLSYWELLADGRFDTRASAGARPKMPGDYRSVGRAVPRLDLPGKFFGQPAYVQDLRPAGMLHARIVRPAPGGRLLSLDASPVERMPGVTRVIRDGSFVAVVAEREEQAVAAAGELRRLGRWEHPALPAPAALRARFEALPIERSIVHTQGSNSAPVARELRASYSKPYIAHASIGPSAAVAQWDGSLMTVWSHAQGMYPLRGALATALDLPEAKIRCIHAEGAGCYGHNGADDAALDAAMIARAVANRPIRLQWSRQDEVLNEPYGSAMFLDLAAGLDASNRIVRWRYDLLSCSYNTRPDAGESAGHMLAARERANPLPPAPIRDGTQPTGGADRNALPLYAVPHQQITEHLVLDPPLRTSALRALGAYGNVFAIESFMDELALLAGTDPFEFRLQHLDDERARAVLRAVRADADAAPALDAPGQVGRGLAFARYKNLSTYVAVIADVSVDEASGVIRFLRAFAAVDAGQVVNPDGLRNQIEGGIVQAASWTLKEAVRFGPDGLGSSDWASYPILRFSEVPEVQVRLLDHPELPFMGAGEAAQGPTAAALANALAAACKLRVRDLPLTPERVRAALATSRVSDNAAA